MCIQFELAEVARPFLLRPRNKTMSSYINFFAGYVTILPQQCKLSKLRIRTKSNGRWLQTHSSLWRNVNGIILNADMESSHITETITFEFELMFFNLNLRSFCFPSSSRYMLASMFHRNCRDSNGHNSSTDLYTLLIVGT